MPLTAQMLHEAFLEAQREVYGIPETQQRSWENLTNKERLAYDWMIEGLNEKLATPDAHLATEAPAMFRLIKKGMYSFSCPCEMCTEVRELVKRVEDKPDVPTTAH